MAISETTISEMVVSILQIYKLFLKLQEKILRKRKLLLFLQCALIKHCHYLLMENLS